MISFLSLVNIAEWRSGLSRLPHKQEIVGSNPTCRKGHKMSPHTFTMVCPVLTNGGTKNEQSK